MTMIIQHEESGSSLRLRSPQWLLRLTELVFRLHASWRQRQNRRVLESLPMDTLKDIGWPVNDTIRR